MKLIRERTCVTPARSMRKRFRFQLPVEMALDMPARVAVMVVVTVAVCVVQLVAAR